MIPRGLAWGLLVVALLCCAVHSVGADEPVVATAPAKKEAFITLLYNDEAFALGVYVLGQSIRATGTTRPMICLIAGEGISATTVRRLEDVGWQVMRVDVIENPFKGFYSRLKYVITKLRIFSLEAYDRLVYFDGDIVVTQNLDELFECGQFCAAVRHSNRFNSGVMVVTPRVATFEHMSASLKQMGSYTGGDQGFLNAYYSELAEAPQFNPGRANAVAVNGRPNPYKQQNTTLLRLQFGYNGDVGMYVFGMKWLVSPREIKAIHYTLGAAKPWDWWIQPYIPAYWEWQRHYENVPFYKELWENAFLMRQFVFFMLWGFVYVARVLLPKLFPHLNSAMVVLGSCERGRPLIPSVTQANAGSFRQRLCLTAVTKAALTIPIGLTLFLVSAAIASAMIPMELPPVHAWCVFLQFQLSLFSLAYFQYLTLAYEIGRHANLYGLETRKVTNGSSAPSSDSWFSASSLTKLAAVVYVVFMVFFLPLYFMTALQRMLFKYAISSFVFGVACFIYFAISVLAHLPVTWYEDGLHSTHHGHRDNRDM